MWYCFAKFWGHCLIVLVTRCFKFTTSSRHYDPIWKSLQWLCVGVFHFIIKAMEFCKERVILSPVQSPSVQSLKLKPATSRISDSQAFLKSLKFSRKSHITLRSKETQHQFQCQDLLNRHQVHPLLQPWTSKSKGCQTVASDTTVWHWPCFLLRIFGGFRVSQLVSTPILSSGLVINNNPYSWALWESRQTKNQSERARYLCH